jgi:predicted ribosome quality control (RQC) complex YloA/Tae2 family protein
MGRHSNLILIGPEGKIIDSVKRVDLDMSSVRQVLPGMSYALPPGQNKLNLLDTTAEEVVARVLAGKDTELSKALMDAIQGLSPLVSRELARQAIGVIERTVSELENHHVKGLRSTIENTITALKNGSTPVMLSDQNGRPKEFSYMPIAQYGSLYTVKEFPSCSELLDAF